MGDLSLFRKKAHLRWFIPTLRRHRYLLRLVKNMQVIVLIEKDISNTAFENGRLDAANAHAFKQRLCRQLTA